MRGGMASGAAARVMVSARTRRPSSSALPMTQPLILAVNLDEEETPQELSREELESWRQNLKGLALAGTVAFERKDFKAAANYWRRMLPLVPPDSEDARAIRANVAEAIQLAGGQAAVPQGAVPQAGVRGTVSISPKLKGMFGPEDTVFIFARAAQGPAMPLALLRRRARELPADFALEDSMAMAPGMNLSAHARVVITARVSKSGTATPQPGDLQGASAPVANDAREVRLIIDTVLR